MSCQLGQIHDVVEVLAERPGAIANLTALPAASSQPGHTHANAYLQLHLLGGYRELGEGGDATIDGPSASFFPAGSAHEMGVAPSGLATVIIEFDPAWLKRFVRAPDRLTRVRHWIGGEVGAQAAALARLWLGGVPAVERFEATGSFLRAALGTPPGGRTPPRWIHRVAAAVEDWDGEPRLGDLAWRLGVSRPWLARAYRAWRGEGLGQSVRRRRVGAAVLMLERADLGLADIAAATGFYDQSHMNRGFREVMGRTPAQVRSANLGLTRPAV
jgi:AraC-like DNA-binding protein